MVYAKQVAPEYQESPLFLDGFFPENIILTGNRDYNAHTTPEYDQISRYFEEMREFWGTGYTLQELLKDYGFERPDGKPWTTKQRHEWRLLLEQDELNDDGIIKALFLLTGKAWEAFTIRGCCQSEWQEGFYPVDEWSREALQAFETEYFNTGSEWIIHDENEEPESPEEITGYSVYCHGWNSDQIRQEIANVAGESDTAAVVLYEFTGFSRSPEYRKAV